LSSIVKSSVFVGQDMQRGSTCATLT